MGGILVGGIADTDPNLSGNALGNDSVSVDYSNVGRALQEPGELPVYPGTKNINADPMFLGGGSGYRLALGSPCIDTADDARLDSGPSSLLGLGDVAYREGGQQFLVMPIEFDLAGENREEAAIPTVPFDLRGNDVNFGGRVSDMGCFERQFDAGPGGV